ncbi:MAG: hypothetical protein AB8G22_24330, partial [Saprospiraceae bacterium]
MNYIWVVALSLLFSTHAFAQPTIDGIFDGAATWGSPITTADAIDGWADASAKNIYFAQDDFYIYLGAEVKASTWMNWVFILNTGTGGGATDTWSRSIDYNHTDAPNYVLRGHFNDYAQFHSWNGTSWDGVGTDASTDDFGENISTDLQDGWVEVRYLKSNLNGATAVEVQFYITGDNNDHGSFDAAPDDNNAVSWNESSNRTSLSNYSSSQSIGAGSSIVTATPALPSDNQQVVIDFDASSTALAGASKVYLHSGVSTNSTDPLAFSEVVGNWGQDDGIGEMTDMGDDNWQITMTSLRNFYGVAVEDDIFGINYLFRSADGTMIEDASGSNYHTVVDPGNFFTLDSPSEDPFLVEINTTFSVETTASAIADWTLEEVDANGNNPTSVTTQMAVNAFSYNMSQGNTNLTYYKLTADFGGTIKSKLFSVKAFSAVTEMARPVGMQPGINYHENDATKATLILHVPTYTQYKKGDGTVS